MVNVVFCTGSMVSFFCFSHLHIASDLRLNNSSRDVILLHATRGSWTNSKSRCLARIGARNKVSVCVHERGVRIISSCLHVRCSYGNSGPWQRKTRTSKSIMYLNISPTLSLVDYSDEVYETVREPSKNLLAQSRIHGWAYRWLREAHDMVVRTKT